MPRNRHRSENTLELRMPQKSKPVASNSRMVKRRSKKVTAENTSAIEVCLPFSQDHSQPNDSVTLTASASRATTQTRSSLCRTSHGQGSGAVCMPIVPLKPHDSCNGPSAGVTFSSYSSRDRSQLEVQIPISSMLEGGS